MAEAGTALAAGAFYGAIQNRREQCGAIFSELRHTSPRKLPSHSHELAFFAVLIEGLYGERYGREERQFRPFTVHFRPAGIPHQDEIGPQGARFFEIEVRPDWRKSMQGYAAAPDLPRDDTHGGELLWLAMALFREVQGGEAVDELSVESLLGELMASAARVRPEKLRARPLWLGRIVEKLRVEYCERFTLAELSREAGVHSVHLSRVFRECMGEGIGEHLHRLRIRAACEQMLEPEMSIAEISAATGFADQSHFTRAFRRFVGMTPAVFRAQLMKSRSRMPDLGSQRNLSRLLSWPSPTLGLPGASS